MSIKTFESFTEGFRELTLPLSKLVSKTWKVEETLAELRRGELSYAKHEPLTVSYIPYLRKYMLVDGHHRVFERFLDGETSFPCRIYDHLPRIHSVDEAEICSLVPIAKELRRTGL